jgi:hypothetical protein
MMQNINIRYFKENEGFTSSQQRQILEDGTEIKYINENFTGNLLNVCTKLKHHAHKKLSSFCPKALPLIGLRHPKQSVYSK